MKEMTNIILMGPPGAGKTTISKMLGEHYNMPVYDIDDDHLETVWNCSVGERLSELGDEKFLQAEGEALLGLKKQNTIIALSGSNPLHEEGMRHIAKQGIVVYLDVPTEVIAERLHMMKVDRIVGMKNEALENILDYRKSFYEKFYDIRVAFSQFRKPEDVLARVIHKLEKNQSFISTRGYKKEGIDFLSVVRQGLAPDGGLFVPKEIPQFQGNELQRLFPLSYQERALRVLEKFPLGKLEAQELRSMIYAAYGDNFNDEQIAPITHLKGQQFLLELFHGPTAAFKDMALQLTPKFFSYAIQERSEKYLILAATSGDTGVAAIEGYKNEKNISVMVLYPENGVSEVQKQQMLSSEGHNVLVLGVEGDFDFCQTTVKQLFNSTELKKDLEENFQIRLSSANSMNWGRLLPQIVYYISTYIDLIKGGELEYGQEFDVCVPTGNFGNLLAAVYANKMGIPIRQFVCASNDNNVLTDFFKTGIYNLKNRELIKTSSPSIDILKSSNIERLLFLLSDENTEEVRGYMENLENEGFFEVSDEIKNKLQNHFCSAFCSSKESHDTIRKTLNETGVLIDTHTAVAKKVADDFQEDRPMVIAATAHWSKFAPAILEALGVSSKGKSIKEIFEEVLKITSKNPVHPMVQKTLEKPVCQTQTSSANKKEIIKILKDFVSK